MESGHCIVNYSVKVNNTWQQLVTTNTSVVITGLSVGSIYEIILTGRDSEGRQEVNSDLLTDTYYFIHNLYQFIFHLGILFTLISTTCTTSTITSTMYIQSTLVFSTVISTSLTTNTSCVISCQLVC